MPEQPAGEPTDPIRVVLVEPMYEGNVGAAARVCKNFGVENLVVVDGPELTDRANMMAVHADDLLETAEHVDTLGEAMEDTHVAVGFTAEIAEKTQDHVRDGLPLSQAAQRARAMEGRIALVFGREDDGLSIEELELMDLITKIPVDPGYASMNLSHAVAVGLYETATRGQASPDRPKAATKEELEILFDTLEHLGRQSRVREHKLVLTMRCIRRVLGRTRLSTWEYHRMMGLFTRTLKALDAWPVPAVKDRGPDETRD